MGRNAYIGRRVERLLPIEYTAIDYIESSGAQFIDTGFIPNQNTRVVLDLKCEATSTTSTSSYICGVRTSSSSAQFALQTLSSNYSARYGTQEKTVVNGAISERYTVDMNKNVFTVNGAMITLTAEMFTCVGTFHIFALNNNGTGGYCPPSTMTLYSCQIYDNGTMVRNFVPCTNESGTAGLYDLVGNKFYGNAGTGDFLCGGGGRANLPSGYTRVNYIESSGTQYINTGVPGKSGLAVKAKYLMSDKSMASGHFLSSCSSGYSNRCYLMSVTNGKYTYGYVSEVITSFSVSAGREYEIEVNTNVGTQAALMNGVVAMTNSNSSVYDNNTPLTIFALNNGGAITGLSSGRIYWLRIYSDSVLVRDYVPVIDHNGEACLYDKCSGECYRNDGTGAFVAGEEVSDSAAESVARVWKNIFVSPNGVARRGIKGWVGVNGTARPFMGDYELAYYGDVEAINSHILDADGATFANFAVFTGGVSVSTSEVYRSVIEGYNADLTRRALANTKNTGSSSFHTYGAEVIEDTVQIRNSSRYIESFDEDFSAVGVYSLGASYAYGTQVGDYVVYPKHDDMRGVALTRDMTATTVENKTEDFAEVSAKTDGHAIYVYGRYGTMYSSTESKVVSYDADLVCLLHSNAPAAEYRAAGEIGGNAVFAGGSGFDRQTLDAERKWRKDVLFFDDDLTRFSAEELTTGREKLECAAHKGFIAFCGGRDAAVAVGDVDVYDENMTKQGSMSVANDRVRHAMAAVGNYILIFGGVYSDEYSLVGVEPLPVEALKFI